MQTQHQAREKGADPKNQPSERGKRVSEKLILQTLEADKRPSKAPRVPEEHPSRRNALLG